MANNTAITLMYRNASNYKSSPIHLVLRGEITDSEIRQLKEKLDDNMLIARQVGLPTPTIGAFDENEDHVFTTWVEMQDGLTAKQMHTDYPALYLIDIHCLVARICAVSRWDTQKECSLRLAGAFERLMSAAKHARSAMCEIEQCAT